MRRIEKDLTKGLSLSARDWIRTSTSFRMLPPEGSASTNFATRAFKNKNQMSNIEKEFRNRVSKPSFLKKESYLFKKKLLIQLKILFVFLNIKTNQ